MHRPTLSGRRSPYTAVRPWAPLSDAEWDALAPFVTRDAGPGRPLRDSRGRLDAMLRNTLADRPWRDLPPGGGCKPDTASRLFRRWTHAGVWMRLLEALAAPDAPAPLRAMEYWICRLVRRSLWVLRRAHRGLHEIVRIKRLGLHSTLPQFSFALYQPDLSELLHRAIARVLHRQRYLFLIKVYLSILLFLPLPADVWEP
jgi:transposase